MPTVAMYAHVRKAYKPHAIISIAMPSAMLIPIIHRGISVGAKGGKMDAIVNNPPQPINTAITTTPLGRILVAWSIPNPMQITRRTRVAHFDAP